MKNVITEISDAVKGLWSLVVGLRVTGENFVKPQVTVHYPRASVSNIDTFRGHIDLVGSPKEPAKPKCIACMMCESLCPSGCIKITVKTVEIVPPVDKKLEETARKTSDGGAAVPAKRMAPPKNKKKKVVTGFDLQYDLCSLCGLCVQNCPVDSLEFSRDVYAIADSRQGCSYDLMARLSDKAGESGNPGPKDPGEEAA